MKSLIFLAMLSAILSTSYSQTDDELKKKASELAQKFIIVDTHVDFPLNIYHDPKKYTVDKSEGEFDYPRAKQGGLNVPFMSIYTPPRLEGTGKSKVMADSLITLVEKIVNENSDRFAIPASVDDVRNHFKQNKISLPMGMENGSPIENDLKNIRYFYSRGVRYITLAHGKSNHISDSSYDENKQWNGLSNFGKDVVNEMNKLGIMIDVSHLSDSAFYDVIEISDAPVIASHSSCRYFTPGFERNMSDEMIVHLAKHGGVIQINFGSSFLRDDIRKKYDEIDAFIDNYVKEHTDQSDEERREFINKYRKENKPPNATVKDVVAHIDHVVKLVGINYVGIGSDFDGVGDTLPEGLKDVSYYPNLIYELLKLGYSEEDIKKICGENLLRVWSEVEDIAKNIEQ